MGEVDLDLVSQTAWYDSLVLPVISLLFSSSFSWPSIQNTLLPCMDGWIWSSHIYCQMTAFEYSDMVALGQSPIQVATMPNMMVIGKLADLSDRKTC